MVTATPLTVHPLNEHNRSWYAWNSGEKQESQDNKEGFVYHQEVPLLPEDKDQARRQRKQRHRKRLWVRITRIASQIISTILLLAVIILVPIMTYQAVTEYDMKTDTATFYSSACFAGMAVLISAQEIYLHFTNWYMPDVQKYTVRILFMVPLYAIQSWFSLLFYEAKLYINNIRDFYEAFVVCAFVYLLIELLGGEEELAETLRSKDARYGIHYGCISWCFRNWRMGEEFMLECKWGVLQYVIIKTLATIAIMILEPLELYGEGSFSLNKAYVYISTILNCSVTWALYCLVLIFHAVRPELESPKNWHPLGKFLCIKGVIFFTFWQGMVIAILVAAGVITEVGSWDVDHVASALQSYLICIEMMGFAIAHRFAYSYKECLPNHSDASITDDDDSSFNPSSDVDYNSYVPPYSSIRTLNSPASVSDALWSTTVPSETITDIKRFSQGTAAVIAKQQQRIPGISMTSKEAESI